MHLWQKGEARGGQDRILMFVSSMNKAVEESSEVLGKCQCSADDFTCLENVWLDTDLF